MFLHVEPYAGDPILSLNETFQKDPRPHRINLSIGIYFDDAGRIPVLESVRLAEQQVVALGGPKPYLPMEGAANCRAAVQRLLFGESHPAIAEGRIATIQSVGSSAALKVGADFLHRFFPASGVWVSDPTWDNHRAMFEGAGIAVSTYPYYDPQTGGLRFDAMCEALDRLPPRSIVLLHACCHNPTGVDLYARAVAGAGADPARAPNCCPTSTSPTRATATASTRTPTRCACSPTPGCRSSSPIRSRRT